MNPAPPFGSKGMFLAGLGVLAVVIVAGGAIWIAAAAATVRDWHILADSRADLARLELRRQVLAAAEAHAKSLDADVPRLRASRVNPSSPLEFIRAIEALGRRSGVDAEMSLSTSPQGSRGEEYFVTASGPFPAVAAFFSNLEELPFLFTLERAELIAGDRLPGTSTVQTVTLRGTLGILLPSP